jgi:hypothetical protein
MPFADDPKPVITISTTKLSVGKRYRASSTVIWDVITDTAKWPRWGPTVKKVEFPDRFIYKGAAGRVLTALNVWLPFNIIEFEDARYWYWKIASVGATGHRIRAIGDGSCDLWFEVPLFAAPYASICQIALNRIERLFAAPPD